MFWYADTMINYQNFNATTPNPSNGLSFSLGGGVKYYFDRFNERLAPYGNLYSHLISKTQTIQASTNVTQNRLTGLYIAAGWGLRVSLNRDFFIDLEGIIVHNPLYGILTTTSISEETKKRSNRSVYNFSIDDGSPVSLATIAFGMRI